MAMEEKEGQKELCGQVQEQSKQHKEQRKFQEIGLTQEYGMLGKGENLEEYDPIEGKSENGKINKKICQRDKGDKKREEKMEPDKV